MEKHISIDEMNEYIESREITPSSIKIANRVNSHILICEKCRKTYSILLKFAELMDRDDSPLCDDNLNWKKLISLRIEEKKKLIIDAKEMLYYFCHPMSVATRSESNSSNMEMSKLVDEENSMNVISIQDGVVRVELDNEEVRANIPHICILDEDNILIDIIEMQYMDGVYRAEFSIDSSSVVKYTIMIR